MPDDTPATIRLRQLITELAKLMQEQYTFSEIADKFYAVGVIEKPENPYYDGYSGTKRDYVHEKLHEAPDLEAFLRTTVPEVIYSCDIEGPSPSRAVFLMKELGYTLDDEDEATKYGIASYKPPTHFPKELLTMSGGSRPTATAIQLPDLPSDIQELVDELNGCLDRGYRNASALLIRKIIHQAVFIVMARRGKAHLLKTKTGDDVGLGTAIAKCSQEYSLSNQVVGRITSAKWIGDSANHSYRAKVTDGDLDRAVTALGLFLQEIEIWSAIKVLLVRLSIANGLPTP